MSMFVKFWGTRGSIPTPGSQTAKYGGNTSCVEIRAGDTLLVCDGGTGLRELGQDLLRRGGNVEGHLFFSHAHWDHIQGFPFFTPAYLPTSTFHVYGEIGNRSIHSLLSGQMQSEYFPVRFSDLGSRIFPGELAQGQEIGGVKVTHFAQWHPGSSLGFAFEFAGRKVVYATDNELDQALLNAEAVDADLSVERKFPQALLDFVKDADLLIADGQYLDDEYPKKRGWGHPRVGTVVDLAIQANAKQLAITHHDPMHGDREVDAKILSCVERAARHMDAPPIFGAREHFELKIG